MKPKTNPSKETYCLEYSTVQKAYHISTKEDMERNVQICKERGIENGYTCLSEHGSYEEANAAMLADMETKGLLRKTETVE